MCLPDIRLFPCISKGLSHLQSGFFFFFCYANKWICQNIQSWIAEETFMSTTAKTVYDELQFSISSVTTALARNPLREAQTLLSSIVSWFPPGSCLHSPSCIPIYLNSPTIHLLLLMKVEKKSIIQCLWISFMSCQSGPGSFPSNKGKVSKCFMEEIVHLAFIQEDDQGHVPGAFIRQKEGWDTDAVPLCSLWFTWRAEAAVEAWICQLPVLMYICVLLEFMTSDYPVPLQPGQELHDTMEINSATFTAMCLHQSSSIHLCHLLFSWFWGCTS